MQGFFATSEGGMAGNTFGVLQSCHIGWNSGLPATPLRFPQSPAPRPTPKRRSNDMLANEYLNFAPQSQHTL